MGPKNIAQIFFNFLSIFYPNLDLFSEIFDENVVKALKNYRQKTIPANQLFNELEQKYSLTFLDHEKEKLVSLLFQTDETSVKKNHTVATVGF